MNQETPVDDATRLRYRYLDLRRERMAANLALRHRVVKFIRDFLTERRFLEIEESATQRTLVRVVEVARVLEAQHAVVPAPEMRDELHRAPESQKLQPVNDVVERVRAQQLHLLHADG